MTNVQGQAVGIDVSMDKIDCCFSQSVENMRVVIKGTRTFENSNKGFEELAKWIKKWLIESMQLSLVMEATGVYYEHLAYYFAEATSYKICVLLPNKSKAFTQSLNVKSKNDKIDAKTLAQMGLERNLFAWTAPSRPTQLIRGLCREKEALIEEKTMITNQLHAIECSKISNKNTLKRLKALIAFLDKQIKEIKEEVVLSVDDAPELAHSIELLSSIPGVGRDTAVVILTETNNFELFKNKAQLVSYAGLDVIENQSGSSVKGKTRISKKGNSRIRKALYFPAMSHINCKSIYYSLFENIVNRTKIKMKAYVAVQRKLLTLMYALHKNQTFFDPNFAQKSAEQKKFSAIGTL